MGQNKPVEFFVNFQKMKYLPQRQYFHKPYSDKDLMC